MEIQELHSILVKTFHHSIMKKPNAASLLVFGFSLGLFASANATLLGSAIFPDVPSGTYYDSAVGEMYSDGIITGYADGKFGPNDFVTRGQVAVMMQRFKTMLAGGNISVSSSSRSSTSTSSSSSSSSSSSTATVTDEGAFRFATGSFTADEDEGAATINVIRYGGNQGTVTVEYEVESATADGDSDYELTSGKLTFADGETSRSFDVVIIDDNESEQNETATLKLHTPGGGASLGTPDQANLTIIDNDEGDGTSVDPANAKGVFTFSAVEYEIAEDIDTITITVNREGTDGDVTVKYEMSDGSANSSYYEKETGTLSFSSGESTKTFDVTIKDNSDVNGNKTVGLKLSNPTGGAALGSLSLSTLIIVDDEVADFENGDFRILEDEYEVDEGETLLITIDRIGGARDEVTIDYTTENAIARSGDDYTEKSGTLTFKEGETQKIITVTTLDDDKNDPEETFRFKISNPTGGANLGSPATSTITIHNQ